MKNLAIVLFFWTATSVASTPWESYLDMPSSENASRVQRIEYTERVQGGYDANDLQILQNQVLAQDAEAFRLGFRLYKKTDGGLSEDIGVILAKSIRAHPAFFLRQVLALNVDCQEFRWILNTPGLEYADRPASVAYEIGMRKRALKNVSSKGLITVRDQCLKEIKTP